MMLVANKYILLRKNGTKQAPNINIYDSHSKKPVILIASPEKAICDKIVMTCRIVLRSSNQVIEFLTQDMRIAEDHLLQLSIKVICSWINDAPKICWKDACLTVSQMDKKG